MSECAERLTQLDKSMLFTNALRPPFTENFKDILLSDNNLCFICNIAITNFLVLHMCEIRFHDVIIQSTMKSKYGWPTWPNEYALEPYLIQFTGFNYVIKRI